MEPSAVEEALDGMLEQVAPVLELSEQRRDPGLGCCQPLAKELVLRLQVVELHAQPLRGRRARAAAALRLWVEPREEGAAQGG